MATGMIAARAAVAPAPAMQRKPVGLVVVAILAKPLRRWLRLWLSAAGDKGWQPLDVTLAFYGTVRLLWRAWGLSLRIARLVGLRVTLRIRLMLARLMLLMLLALLVGLAVPRRVGRLRLFAVSVTRLAPAHHRVMLLIIIAVIGVITGLAAFRPIRRRLALAELVLRGGDHAEIMLGVLVVIFRRDRIAG
jgi:hypothetical protein